MKTLYEYIFEGGASGHMHHPQDYTDYTLRDLKGLIRNLFSGKIEATEKVDGMNIQATLNKFNEVVFIRNKTDLNSERGGMTMDEMVAKWSDKPHVLDTFITAAKTIESVLSQMPVKFWNPDDVTKLYINCECVIAGKTNIMPYDSDQVDFHNIWIYKFDGNEWVKDSETKNGLSTVDKYTKNTNAMITPNVIVKITDESMNVAVSFIKELDSIWKKEGLKEYDTIDTWKKVRFKNYSDKNMEYLLKSKEGLDILYRRWFEADKSTNIKVIKSLYKDNEAEISNFDKKDYKDMVRIVMEPLDNFILKLGNAVISLCDGIINSGCEDRVVAELKNDLDEVVADVRKDGSVELNDKLSIQLDRLSALGDNNINAVEGIVFMYKGKLMKLTGGFAPLNQILGSIKYSK